MFAAPAGAADENARRRRSSARRLLVVLLACGCVLAAARCGGGGDHENPAPDRLFDGSRARAPSTRLAGLDEPAILTTIRTENVATVDDRSPAGLCLANDWGTSPAGVVVERTGANAESVTFLNTSRRQVLGCDNGGGPREDERRWCGVAAGQLYAGRLRDPRLDLDCSTGHGEPLGFVWVQPAEGARYVAVQQQGYTEVYEVAGALPVRIATNDVDLDSLRASFAVSEYTTDGKLLREYGMTATPAG